jgi:hypothetical protein
MLCLYAEFPQGIRTFSGSHTYMLDCFGAAPVMMTGRFMRRADGVQFTEEL